MINMTKKTGKPRLMAWLTYRGRTIWQAYSRPSAAKQRIWLEYADKPYSTVVAVNTSTFSVAWLEDGVLHWVTPTYHYVYELDDEDKEYLDGQGIHIV